MIFEALIIHDELNPDLFENNKLKPEVREKLISIVDYFHSVYLDFEIPILDINLVGSNASFNYSEHSDIDLHIVTNFEMVDGGSRDMMQLLFNLEKSSFNASYDIFVKGREVEIYIEDVKTTAVSNGVYSILQDKWVKFPSPIEAITADTSADLEPYVNHIDDTILSGNADAIQMEINNLYLMRKNAIDTEGEYGYGNQLFKDIRATGRLDALKDAYKELKSQQLSLEELEFGELY